MILRAKSWVDVNTPRWIKVAFDLREPQFDFVQPGGRGRDEVQLDLRMGVKELLDLSRLVSRQIVEDDVDFTFRLVARP